MARRGVKSWRNPHHLEPSVTMNRIKKLVSMGSSNQIVSAFYRGHAPCGACLLTGACQLCSQDLVVLLLGASALRRLVWCRNGTTPREAYSMASYSELCAPSARVCVSNVL